MQHRVRADVSSGVRWLVVAGCVVTGLLAALGMRAIWEWVEWVELPGDNWSWGTAYLGTGRSAFWYQNGLAVATVFALVLAWLPRSRGNRALRVAVLLPIIHLALIAAAWRIWSVLDADVVRLQVEASFRSGHHLDLSLPTLEVLLLGFAAIVAISAAIKWRHGEWAHAMVTLALAFLVMLGLWLPIASRLAVHSTGYWSARRVLGADAVAWLVVLPAALGAVAFVVLVFRRPQLLARLRPILRAGAIVGFFCALLLPLHFSDEAWMVYLESSYLLITAVVLAVAALVLFACVALLRPRFARCPRGVVHETGTIAADEHGEVARFEITSWLRGPRLVARPFVVTTARGNVPITGAQLRVPVPAASTSLGIGEHVGVLRAGDPVIIASRTTAAEGHPFRASDAAEVVAVSTPDARRFGEVALVVWRPAVAYLAILVAVALPYLTIFLT